MIQELVSNTRYVKELKVQYTRLEDEVRELHQEVRELRKQRDQAQADALQARASVADWLAEQRFGRPIFGSKAPLLANETVTLEPEPVHQRVQARQLVREREAEFMQKLAEMEKGANA